MVEDSFKLKGELRVTIVDENGTVKYDEIVPNMVVNTGKNFVAASLGTTTSITFGFMAVGTGSTSVSAGQTALVAESARVAAAPSIASNVATYTGVYGPGTGTGTLAEAGIFSASSNGTMFSRALIGPTTKAANDTLTITWSITVG